ncbi:hemK methyltransferase family member 2 [Fopius arisanus]|uniref:Methyltransferase HEMK2 n=1 Tax=Fopius arisanus TaxID=64838 RepID=A0A9R1SYN0_9HYME|nr:PREDICTED: hemK methyltransferase family member 2 [Fopius arisanus]
METPIVKLSDLDAETVYEPSEDSFLLIDSLETDLKKFEKVKPNICMEIGSGSGVVITALAMAFKRNNWPGHFIAIDINPDACRVTKNTSIINSTNVDIIRMDLVSSLKANHLIDILIFNPPYVVTESSEIFDDRLISKTWAGGRDGREVMDRLFSVVPNLLSSRGIFYLVVIRENKPSDIIDIFEGLGMSGVIAMERRVRGEHLYILRFVKNSTQ